MRVFLLNRNLFHAGIAARETAQALKTLAQAARGVAASTTDPKAAAAMLDSARDVMEGSALLIEEAKQALVSPGDAESQQRLAQVSRLVVGGVSEPKKMLFTCSDEVTKSLPVKVDEVNFCTCPSHKNRKIKPFRWQ